MIKEATGKETTEEMVQSTIEDYKSIMKALKTAMNTAAEEGDDRTEDLLNATYQSVEKHVWMLNAYLGN